MPSKKTVSINLILFSHLFYVHIKISLERCYL